MLHQISESLVHRIKLWYLVQHSLTAYHYLSQHFGSPELATQEQALRQWASLSIHTSHKQRASEYLKNPAPFFQCLQALCDYCDFILADDDEFYPEQLKPFDDKTPLLFGQGNLQALAQTQIAIVGSRKTSPYGIQIAHDFAYKLADYGFYITSGLATGIDTAAHQAGAQFQRTIAVIGSGLDQIYPAANRGLHQHILRQQGAVITEFLPQTPPLQHHFPRRNRIISGLSLGALVVEAAIKSGSISTAKWALEQGKTVFAIPGHIHSEHHKGCHLLIREGAILVDEPQQIIDELSGEIHWYSSAKPTTQSTLSYESKAFVVEKKKEIPIITNKHQHSLPEHLQGVYQYLDFSGINIDQLHIKTGLAIQDLTAQLVELELLGMCLQRGGLYLRV